MCGERLPGFLAVGAEVGEDCRDRGDELIAGCCEGEFCGEGGGGGVEVVT